MVLLWCGLVPGVHVGSMLRVQIIHTTLQLAIIMLMEELRMALIILVAVEVEILETQQSWTSSGTHYLSALESVMKIYLTAS